MKYRKLAKILTLGVCVLTMTAFWTGRNVFRGKSNDAWGREIIIIRRNPFRCPPTEKGIYFDTSLDCLHRFQSFAKPNITTQSSSIDITSSRQCNLQWNEFILNITNYEANDTVLAAQRQINHGKNYIPALLCSDPKLKLDIQSYLLPALDAGPNNQLFGFLDSIFMAIQLNRTLVLPSFIKHKTDRHFERGLSNKISPIHRVDVLSLCKYVSCIAIDQFRRACNFEIDGVLNTRYLREKDVSKIEQDSGMNLQIVDRSIDDILIPKNATSRMRFKFTFSVDEIPSYFTSKARCVVHPFPFYDVMHKEDDGLPRALQSTLDENAFQGENVPPDTALMADIFRHVPRPTYVRDIASQFIDVLIGGKGFLGAHWRYNEGDFLEHKHCQRKELNKKRCDRARNYTSQNFADRLATKAKLLMNGDFKIHSLYIASPRTNLRFINDTAEELSSMRINLKIYHSIHLERFMKERYHVCDFIATHFDDILSSVEMEICSRGVSFLGSLGTTWSSNVFRSRMQLDKHHYEISPQYIFRD